MTEATTTAATTTTAAATTTTAATTTAAPPHGIAWLTADADTELVGHVQAKGWQSPVDAAKSHRELEKMFGADRAGRTVTLPKDDNDQPAWQAVFERLGRPANPQEYKLPVPEGQDGAFAQKAASKFHELGLSAKQARGLAEWWNGEDAALMKTFTESQAAAAQAEAAILDKDWGAEKAGRMELARRAALKLGLDEASITALQQSAGHAKAFKALAAVGDMLREAKVDGLGDIGSFGMTPEGAKAMRAQKMADQEFVKRAMNANSAEWAEIKKYDAIIAGKA